MGNPYTYLLQLRAPPGVRIDRADAFLALANQAPLVASVERRWKLPEGEVAVLQPPGNDESLVWFQLPAGGEPRALVRARAELATVASELDADLREDGVRIELDFERHRAAGDFLVTPMLQLLAQRFPVEHLPERTWKLKSGSVAVEPIDGALELSVPLLERACVQEALHLASVAARRAGLELFDPQLGRLVVESDEAEVVARFAQGARAQLGGLAEPPGPAPDSSWMLLGKVLKVAFVLAMVAALVRSCLARGG